MHGPSQGVNQHGKLLNVSGGTLIKGIGGIGGDKYCSRSFNSDCSTLPRQLIAATDFALDPTGRHLYVATQGLDDVGECSAPDCADHGVHDNSSRLIKFDLQRPDKEPVTMSYCGPFKQVKYDAKRNQVVALRHALTPDGRLQTTTTAEVVAFDAHGDPAVDAKETDCNLYPGIGVKQTCACAKGLDPKMNGKVIGRAGLVADGILPAATMTIQGENVLVGDQNQFCVLAYPLDGSAGKQTKGTPVGGTCGKSCGEQGCASIEGVHKAGKHLGDGSFGNGLRYELFNSLDGKLLLHDNNQETIDYGKSPKAETNYLTVPIQPPVSSVFFIPTFQPGSGDVLVLESFSRNGYLLGPTSDGFGKGKKVLDTKKDLAGSYLDERLAPMDVIGVPAQWAFTNNATKLLVMAEFQLPTGVGGALDYAFVEFNLKKYI